MDEYSHDLEKKLEALEMEVHALNAMRNDLLKRVEKEEDRGLQVLPQVKRWVSMVEEIEPKAVRLLDKSISALQKLSKYDDISKIPPPTQHYSETVCMTLKEVETHKSKGVFKELVERAPLSHLKKMLPLQNIASREMLLDKVWKSLAENESRTLGFYGMSGVGKTTLLTQVKNKFIEVRDVSTLVIFVVVKCEEVERLQDEIGEKLGLYGGQGNKQEKASEIFKFLSRKRFVLLLDGMQRKMDLEEIGVPLPGRENGCKIIFTTDSQEACGSQWIDVVEEVKCLSTEESWDLFQKTVGETTLKSHPDIPQLARIVARKCGGLPIALNLIGRTMSHKRTIREWHRAIHDLVSSIPEFSDRKEVSVLKFAYDNLSDDNMKMCFLYCTLFPRNSDISKQDLVDYWIGEGIIDEEDREIAEIKGYEMVGDLVRMGLLLENESGYGVKMHDMVLEMALWVASQASDSGWFEEHFVVKWGESIYEMPMVNDWNMVRRMSVTSTQIETISGSPPCSKLRTLFLQGNDNLKQISGDFFQWMTSLAVLNLSYNRELSELPEEVSSLVSLQFLNLSGTWINRLPLGLKELKRLIHLDLDYTINFKDIEVIGSLLNLQVLRLFWSVPINLGVMEDIQRLKSLKELSLTVVEDSVFVRLLSSYPLRSCIRRLRLKYTTITDGITALLNAMFSVRELDIFGCNIPESTTIDWRSTIQRETVLSGTPQMIPQFRNLRTVCLYECNGLRDLTWLLATTSLDDLTLCKCPHTERVISKEKATAQLGHTTVQPFQNLTRLSLNDLPKLESIYWTPLPFPVLEDIIISRCPKLKRLPFNSESAIGNQLRLDLDEEWIKGVEWEDEATKQRFSGLDNRDFPKMAEEQKMDGLESHPTQNKVLVGTIESGESASLGNISQKQVLQLEINESGVTMEPIQAYIVSTPEILISNMIDDGGTSLDEEWTKGVEIIENLDKVLVETTESSESATASSISKEKVLQLETNETGGTMEFTQAYGVSTSENLISNTIDGGGTSADEECTEGVEGEEVSTHFDEECTEGVEGEDESTNFDEEWIKGIEGWEDEATKQRFTDTSNRGKQMMAEEESVASELHPTQNKLLAGTTEGATTSSISGKKVLQSETNLIGVPLDRSPSHTHRVSSTPDGLISNTVVTPPREQTPRSYDNPPPLKPMEKKVLGEGSGSEKIANLKVFTLADLKKATKNFRPDSILGEGSFGRVYKGWVKEESLAPSRAGVGIPVAVKKSNPDSAHDLLEDWQCEVRVLGKYNHPNLVKLLGYCSEKNQYFLVYEYLPKGSLENHLFSKGSVALPWDTRLKIAITAAQGLAFLHNSEQSVIYRDFKASNILLDSDFNAKLSDFGLAKHGPMDGFSHVTTRVMGTYGYAAPEYLATGHLYVRSDVYGFGVVLLEILTGLRTIDPNRPSSQRNLVEWFKPNLSQKKKIKKMVDPRLENKIPPLAVAKTAKLILRCLEAHPKNRPSMDDVLRELKIVKTIRDEHKEERRKGVALERSHTLGVSTPDGLISNTIDTPGTEGFVSFVTEKLWHLLSLEYEQFRGAENQVSELKYDLLMLKSFLKDAHAKKHTSAVVKTCFEEAKEIIYDTEDILESFLLKDKLGITSGTKNRIRRFALIITGRKEMSLEMEDISKRLSKVIHDMKSIGGQQSVVDSGSIAPPLYDRQSETRQTFSGEYESDLLGLEENIKKLVEVMVEEANAQVVSITGMGGVGKTTLAREVFNHEEVKHHFDGFAWVCVSQDFTRKYVWQAILQNLISEEDQSNILEKTELELYGELYQLLGTSKSLIVLDDIWREEDWQQIRIMLPPEKGWKVLLTSRNESIEHRDTSHIYFPLNCLSDENSWKLLQKIAFPKRDASELKVDHEEMENMGKQIIKFCGGLPLAIKVLGGFLAANYTVHDWKRVFEGIESGIMGAINSENDSVYHILSLSFEELPYYLKQCFLYLAHFPEDYTITVEKLSYYWAAEGIIGKSTYYSEETNEETIQDVGENCVEELVRRNMVISGRNSLSSRFKTCHLHEMMREFCLYKAKEENFLQIVGNYTPTTNSSSRSTSRRLVTHNPTMLQDKRDLSNRKLRSLLIAVGDNMEVDCILSSSSFTRLQLLRVLDLSKASLHELPSSIGDLTHLRYLSLHAAKVSNLPSSLRNLRLLIYLNIEIYTNNIFVPNFLRQLQELRYLALPRHMHGNTKLELDNQVKLETLRNFSTKNSSIKDLCGMTRLRNLRMLVNDETGIRTLSGSIAGLSRLEYLSIEDVGSSRTNEVGELVLDFIHLKHLELHIRIPRLQQELPSHLTYIYLDKCQLEEDPMPILDKLLHLQVVHLVRRSFCGKRMVCSGGGFPQLYKLELSGLVDLEEWIVEEGSMPLLHTLEILGCERLKEIPDGLQFINALNELIVDEIWEDRLSEGGEDYYKVQHIPTLNFKRRGSSQ